MPHYSYDDRGAVNTGIDEVTQIDKSPFVRGFIGALKGIAAGMPVGGFTAALMKKNPLVGAALGAAGGGLLLGASEYVKGDLENKTDEARLRYHLLRLKGREPLVYLPPPAHMQRIFSDMHLAEHAGE